MSGRWAATVVAVGVALASVAVAAAGIAQADCTGAGDFGAGSGCPPPGGSSDSGDSWPPTSVDWPPAADAAGSGGADAGTGGSSGAGGETGGHESAKPTPIVLPLGQQAPPPSEHRTPIVPVD